MVVFSYLNKAEKEVWLPKLFDLLYGNMSSIAPSGLSYEKEKEEWFSEVSPALDKPQRQIIIAFVDNEPIGYAQYYTRERVLTVEEVQIAKEYQRTLIFYRLCRYLSDALPSDIEYIEAYADRRNVNSQKMMQKLCMKTIEMPEDSPFVRFFGSAENIKRYLK